MSFDGVVKNKNFTMIYKDHEGSETKYYYFNFMRFMNVMVDIYSGFPASGTTKKHPT